MRGLMYLTMLLAASSESRPRRDETFIIQPGPNMDPDLAALERGLIRDAHQPPLISLHDSWRGPLPKRAPKSKVERDPEERRARKAMARRKKKNRKNRRGF